MAFGIKKLFGRKKKPQEVEPIKKVGSVRTAAAGKEIKPKVKKPHLTKRPSPVIYRTLKKVLVSEKSTDLNEKGQYVFLVTRSANKNQIRQAIQDLYGVKVRGVHTINMPAKPRVWRGHHGYRHGLEKGYKKAIVTLATGEKIEVLPR